ncbi:DUF1572 domain-containing protein [Virgibacillus sp. AGTR]|uniref:DUF1572 family protein n=1 Tax=Virgibacillus sp. AGTR TaxID=2812055 RepID=UPI0019639D79|nr:DUF1572 family protein [Virgibacillus sp. AGTR]MCC2250616.1 DUF1572 domain-containing protein [Virgibacillus sp. AGTR]QRZ18467.1 DUF1572 family protein [Virgibacillus sp. AGTR]
MGTGQTYLQVINSRFNQLKNQGDRALEQLEEPDIHWVPNEAANSIAVIVKHMSGNMVSRWTDFLTSDGEKENRNRDQEFINTIASKDDLLETWEYGWRILISTLQSLKEEDLEKYVTIRSQSLSVIDAIERQLTHYSSHIGQILYIGKQLKGTQWQSLSIPKGKSEEYLKEMKKKHGTS